MDSGLTALASGLGGVLITAVAAYLGPLRLQRRKAEADLALEIHREQVSREAADAETSRQANAAEASRLEALITKVIAVRVAMALALQTYRSAIHDLKLGHPVDYAAFRAEAHEATLRVHEASAGLLASRVFMPSGGYGDHPVGTTPVELPPERLGFLDHLDRVMGNVELARKHSQPGRPLGTFFADGLDNALKVAASSRQTSLQRLIREIEQRHGVQISSLVAEA